MGAKIIWSETALKSYSTQIEHLLEKWSEAEADAFAELTSLKVAAIAAHPYIGRPTSKHNQSLRQIVLNKRVILIYEVFSEQEIHLVYFWNTHQSPAKKPV